MLSCVLFNDFDAAVFACEDFSSISEFFVIGVAAAIVSAAEEIRATTKPSFTCVPVAFSLMSLKTTLPFFQISSSLL